MSEKVSKEARALCDSLSQLPADRIPEYLAAQLVAAEERGRLQGQFSPLGDNHHNAAACPYCGDLLTKAEERGRRRGVEERDELRALLREARRRSLNSDGTPIPLAAPFVARIDAALAPRDSAPECNAVVGSDPPPACERHTDTFLFVDQCGFCGGEGAVDRYEENPLLYDEGDMWPCDNCEGRGWFYECQRCLDGEPESVRIQPEPRSGT